MSDAPTVTTDASTEEQHTTQPENAGSEEVADETVAWRRDGERFPDDRVARHEVVMTWTRPVDHPRDDLEELNYKLKNRFTNALSEWDDRGQVAVVAGETDPRGRSSFVVEIVISADVPPISKWARQGVKEAIRRYNKEDDRRREPLRPRLAIIARSQEEKPHRHPKKRESISKEKWEWAKERAAEWEAKPDDAPKLWPDEVYTRTLEAGEPPTDFPEQTEGSR